MSPPLYPTHSSRAVHTVVAPTHRAVLERACEQLGNGPAPRVRAQIKHFDTTGALWATFPFEADATAVLDVDSLPSHPPSAPARTPHSTLAGFVAAWDHTLLLCGSENLRAVDDISRSTLAVRVQILPRDVEDPCWYAIALQALWSRSVAWARPTTTVPADAMFDRIGRLPSGMQRWVLHALSSPAEWNAQLLADACGVSPRTLERRFAEVGLTSRGRLLQQARLSEVRRLHRTIPV